PGARPGIVSMFCSRAYTASRPGWRQLEEALVWGGQALIFSREVALSLLADQQVLRHRLRPGNDGLAHIDWLIRESALRERVPVHRPTPSLAQHIGHVSPLWEGVHAAGNRRADQFAGTLRRIVRPANRPPRWMDRGLDATRAMLRRIMSVGRRDQSHS